MPSNADVFITIFIPTMEVGDKEPLIQGEFHLLFGSFYLYQEFFKERVITNLLFEG